MVLGAVQVEGRVVRYAEWGDLGGFPVLVMHGTPGSRRGRWSDPAALAAAGVDGDGPAEFGFVQSS